MSYGKILGRLQVQADQHAFSIGKISDDLFNRCRKPTDQGWDRNDRSKTRSPTSLDRSIPDARQDVVQAANGTCDLIPELVSH